LQGFNYHIGLSAVTGLDGIFASLIRRKRFGFCQPGDLATVAHAS
jgi:hypothetical protein